MIKSSTLDFLQKREQGCHYGSRTMSIDLDQSLITNNKIKHTKIASIKSSNDTKAVLLSLSIDKKSFAVATSDYSIGICCTISGENKLKLIGPKYSIYSIAWHPNDPNIISSSDLSGSVFVWDISKPNKGLKILEPVQSWHWRPFHSLSYSLCFHPCYPILTIARDREIRFVNWFDGNQVSLWRFYSEFSWVPWLQWSFVGSSLLASVGNPQDNCLLNPIVKILQKDFSWISNNGGSPVFSGCTHGECHNEICIECDSCYQMTQLHMDPPTYEMYEINSVDLIRFVLSRPSDWFADLYICMDCRIRFRLWSNSISLVDQPVETNQSQQPSASSTNKEQQQQQQQLSKPPHQRPVMLPYDIDSSKITVIEGPISPELIWHTVCENPDKFPMVPMLNRDSNQNDKDPSNNTTSEHKEIDKQCKQLLRCVAMFERECLRHCICWCCIQQLHQWLLAHNDLKRFLYENMIDLRDAVNNQFIADDLRGFDPQTESVDHSECLKISLRNINDRENDVQLSDIDENISTITNVRRCQAAQANWQPLEDRQDMIDFYSNNSCHGNNSNQSDDSPENSIEVSSDYSYNASQSNDSVQSNASSKSNKDVETNSATNNNKNDNRDNCVANSSSNINDADDGEPPRKKGAFDFANVELLDENVTIKDFEHRRKSSLTNVLRFLQLYINQPSSLGDIIDIMMTGNHNTNRSNGVSCYPYLNVSKIESYSLRRWHTQPIISESGYLQNIHPIKSQQKTQPSESDKSSSDSSLVVPNLIPSQSNVSNSLWSHFCVRLSNCGRKIAVFIRPKDFPSSLLSLGQNNTGPIVGIYSVEPDGNCGQLLHYYQFSMLYQSIFMDFSPLDNRLLVTVIDSNSSASAPESEIESNVLAVVLNLESEPIYNNLTTSQQSFPKSMSVLRYITAPDNVDTNNSDMSQNNNDSINNNDITSNNDDIILDILDNPDLQNLDDGTLCCVVWNKAGGLLYSKSRGSIYSVNFMGC